MEKAGRVVVGVHDSLAGLRALRLAVAEARRREATLHAVRVSLVPSQGFGPALLAEDRRAIEHAFATALGGFPTDLDVEMVALLGSPGPALTGYACRETDLLVVGAGRRGRLRRLLRGGGVAGHCVAHATCQVLAVPPQQLARAATTRAATRALHRDVRRLIETSPSK